jgi:fructokinase
MSSLADARDAPVGGRTGDGMARIGALGIGAFGPTGVNPALPSYGKILETPKTAWRHFDFLSAFRPLDIPMGYDTDVNVACLG